MTISKPGTARAPGTSVTRAPDSVWSGRPNPTLVAEVGELPPRTALDAGAGEGGDACWLAAQGWQVTALDFSAAALHRVAEHAAAAGVEVTGLQLDLTRQPVPGRFDLVTSHYLQLPRDRREVAFGHLADAVAPGGTLLIVGHDPSDSATSVHRPHLAEMGWTALELAAGLGPEWSIEVAQSRPRIVRDAEGVEVSIGDAVLRAVRSVGR